MTPITLVVLGMLGNHRPLLFQSRLRIWMGSLSASVAGLSLITLALFTVKSQTWSRLFIFSFAFFSFAGLGVYRLILLQYFTARRTAGFYAKNILLVGKKGPIDWMTRYFAERIPAKDYCLIGYLDVDPDQPRQGDAYCEKKGSTHTRLNYMGGVRDLGEILVHRPVHEVIVIYPSSGGEWLKQIVQNCDYFRVALHIVPEPMLMEELRDLQILYRYEPLKLPAVSLLPPQWDSEVVFCKRLFDITVSAVLLLLLCPFFLLIAIIIKIGTPHLPVFYRWRVVGRNGVEFTGYKFTTMVGDADELKAHLMAQNQMNGPVFKMENDPRVTPFGRFLRKYSLNELPQLVSVFKGDMSLVGPRPAFRHELDRYEFWHKRKLSIKPGITCLWQVRGRNRINNFDDWVKMDLEYIDTWSLWLDFKILVKTAWIVVRGTGW